MRLAGLKRGVDMTGPEIIVAVLGAWFGFGALIAILFLIFGVARLDASAKGASFLFRPTIFLGFVILWPAVVIRVLSGVKINQANEEDS